MKLHTMLAVASAVLLFSSCQKNADSPSPINNGTAKVNFIFKFDSTQVRLNAIGQPSPMPVGNAGQSPRFNTMSAHYVELAPSPFTALGAGAASTFTNSGFLSTRFKGASSMMLRYSV